MEELTDAGPDVAGKVAVVTGASRGLGAGLAEALSARGMRLGLCARSTPVLAGRDGVVARKVDVADTAAVDALCEEVAAALGPIELWVNNAGVLEPVAPVRDLDVGEVRHHLDVNLLGVLNGSRAFVRHVRARAGRPPGVLVNITSGAGRSGYPGWAAYGAGKAGVDRLTESIAAEEDPAVLRALAVAPGVVDTAMQATLRATPPERFPRVDRFLRLHQEGRFNRPPWVAAHVLRWAFDPAERPDEVVVRVPDER